MLLSFWRKFRWRHHHTMVQKSQESRRKYWATCSSIRLFACTAHSFACSLLLALLAHSAALICLIARSFTHALPSLWGKWMIRCLKMTWFCPTVHHRPRKKGRSMRDPAHLKANGLIAHGKAKSWAASQSPLFYIKRGTS